MRSRLTGFLAVFAMALPVAGPAGAESRMIPLDADAPVAAGEAPADNATPEPAAPAPAEPLLEPIGGGMASYYGRELAGARTASGQRFDPAGYTAAHRTLPFGTKVQVTNAATGDSVVVTINDRGPFHGRRVLDMSEAAARRIGLTRTGSGAVRLAVVRSAG